METEDEYVASATLMILGEDLDPSKVTAWLELEPSKSWRRGEEKELAPGNFYEWGGWKCFSEQSDDTLEEKIESWLVLLQGRNKEFSKMNSLGWRCSIDCFLAFDSVSSLSVSPDLTRRISELGLTLDICLNN
ncbi:DUF4279 domain-containing protein [Persicirhabdus sediminis]|uniref:DUF4279 domain-containing protein n=1 Tax=Persicirhabdus sediminis TaxID=454144 RepID=A0A8J7SKX4_9BACT|nr:DUF4279 domain-containing protein [Persicirhabdus sediminis]MBK1790038.1 DUF4279 domain-containing protein [Persicirhabdus sediminis]